MLEAYVPLRFAANAPRRALRDLTYTPAVRPVEHAASRYVRMFTARGARTCPCCTVLPVPYLRAPRPRTLRRHGTPCPSHRLPQPALPVRASRPLLARSAARGRTVACYCRPRRIQGANDTLPLISGEPFARLSSSRASSRPGRTSTALARWAWGRVRVAVVDDGPISCPALRLLPRSGCPCRPGRALRGGLHPLGVSCQRRPSDRPDTAPTSNKLLQHATRHVPSKARRRERSGTPTSDGTVARGCSAVRVSARDLVPSTVVHYQPKADLATGTVTSVEALVRWHHPEHGLLRRGSSCRLPADLPDHAGSRSSSSTTPCPRLGVGGPRLDLRVAVNLSMPTC